MRTSLITCALLAAASAAVAQVPAQEPQAAQQPPAAPQASPQFVIVEGNLKGVVRLYEYALNDAIIRAGTNLQNWAREKVGPGLAVYIVPAAPPKVSAMLLPDNSLAFDIHLAEMNVTGLEIAMQMKPQQQRVPDKGDPKVTATGLGLTPPDPMTPVAPAVTSGGKPVSASQAYSDFVREALLDTLVSHGHMLPIGAGQMLTVQVTPVDVAVTNVFDKNPSRKLILSIKGDDLDQFRQKTLTKDQLLLRVIDRRF